MSRVTSSAHAGGFMEVEPNATTIIGTKNLQVNIMEDFFS